MGHVKPGKTIPAVMNITGSSTPALMNIEPRKGRVGIPVLLSPCLIHWLIESLCRSLGETAFGKRGEGGQLGFRIPEAVSLLWAVYGGNIQSQPRPLDASRERLLGKIMRIRSWSSDQET